MILKICLHFLKIRVQFIYLEADYMIDLFLTFVDKLFEDAGYFI